MVAVAVTDLDVTAARLVMSAILKQTPGVPSKAALVCVGDNIDVGGDDQYLRGHGTWTQEEAGETALLASVCGVIERMNKLITVRPLRGRYTPELGDVVVGRITQIESRKWIVDLGAQQRCGLHLNAVQLPDGLQRRRTAEDELNMRHIFREGDLIVAEVQQVGHDRSIALHMRNKRHRKLGRGQLVRVPAPLMQRKASHIVDVREHGVYVVLGCNGWVWVGVLDMKAAEAGDASTRALDFTAVEAEADFLVDASQWQHVTRYCNAARGLAVMGLPTHIEALTALVNYALQSNIAIASMLDMTFLAVGAQLEAQRREASQSTASAPLHL